MRRALLSLAFGCSALLSASLAAASKPADPGGVRVEPVSFYVTLSDHQTYRMAAYHYAHGGSHARPLQVLVHGATYDHRYWDAGTLNGVDYSYARYMAERGYEVIAVDQLGAGESDKPFGYFFGVEEAAEGLRQVVASLRTKHNPTGRRYGKIALVGHSNGSFTSIYEESLFHSADAVVTTGWGHTAVPVNVDQNYIAQLLSAPYLQPDAFPAPFRAALFYYLPTTDPEMVDYDASTLATTMPSAQFLDVLLQSADPSTDGVAGVTAHVLVQLAEHDVIAPSVNAPLEGAYWSSAASVTVESLDDIGHDVNLHLNHMQSWTRIDTWLGATLGHDDGDDDDDDDD